MQADGVVVNRGQLPRWRLTAAFVLHISTWLFGRTNVRGLAVLVFDGDDSPGAQGRIYHLLSRGAFPGSAKQLARVEALARATGWTEEMTELIGAPRPPVETGPFRTVAPADGAW